MKEKSSIKRGEGVGFATMRFREWNDSIGVETGSFN